MTNLETALEDKYKYPNWLTRNPEKDDQGYGFSELTAAFKQLKNLFDYGLSVNQDKIVAYLLNPDAALEEGFVTVGESQVQAEVDPYMSDAVQETSPEELNTNAIDILSKIKEIIATRGMNIEPQGFKLYVKAVLSAPPAGD